MTIPALQAEIPDGRPRATPIYIVDSSGNSITSSNGQSVTITNANANGQALSSASSPVVLASDQSSIPVKPSFTEMSSLSAGSLNADLVPSVDVSAYRALSLYINTNAYSGTISFQCSNDNVNWLALTVTNFVTGSTVTTTTVTNALYIGVVNYRYLRVRMTSYASGAAQGTLELYTLPPSLFSFLTASVSQSGTWTVQPGNTQNTTPWLIAHANNNASVPTGAGNTVVKAAPGALATIVVTTAGTGAGNVQLFDNASTNSGTVLFAFPATISVAQFYQIYGWGKLGITAQNVANGPVFTVFYA